jgi:hypothetical protein
MLNRVVGDDMIQLSSHSNMNVLEDCYLDKSVVTQGLKMTMF